MSQTEHEADKSREARVDLVTKLNLIAGVIQRGELSTIAPLATVLAPVTLEALLKEAAAAITECEQYRLSPDKRYYDSINRYRRALQDALEIADDPFKAPEQVVQTSRDVLNACWDMQTEFAAGVRVHERKSDEPSTPI